MLLGEDPGRPVEESTVSPQTAGEIRTVHAGFIPLVDCAVLVVAAEKGFARTENVNLVLSRESSWANIRDKLTIGQFDCAHMLAGVVIASQLDLGNPMVPLIAPLALGLNGNAITVSDALWSRMAEASGLSGEEGPADVGAALAKVVAADRAAGRPPLSFGMVYPYSCHNYELRYWLAAAGIHPDRDVRLAVVPPPFMPDYLRDGYLDGFCVGEPWNSISVSEGLGRIVVPKSWLWRLSPEKVLGVRSDWAEANAETLDALVRALTAAAAWCGRPENRSELSALLSQPEFLDAPTKIIRSILAGTVPFSKDSPAVEVEDYVVFDKAAATFPWRSHAMWIYSQMVRWGQVPASPKAASAAALSYQPEVFRRAVRDTDVTVPGGNVKVEGTLTEETPFGSNSGRLYLGPDGFFDGRTFDPDRLDAYIDSFDIHSRSL